MKDFDIVCKACGREDSLTEYDTISPIKVYKNVRTDDPVDYVPPNTAEVICVCGNSERLVLNT